MSFRLAGALSLVALAVIAVASVAYAGEQLGNNNNGDKLDREALASLSKLHADTKEYPLEERCQLFENKLRELAGHASNSLARASLFDSTIIYLSQRRMPFGNSQPVLQLLLKCTERLSDGARPAESRRDVIASPTRPGAPLQQQEQVPQPMQEAHREFREVKNNVKDFGQDLYGPSSLPSAEPQPLEPDDARSLPKHFRFNFQIPTATKKQTGDESYDSGVSLDSVNSADRKDDSAQKQENPLADSTSLRNKQDEQQQQATQQSSFNSQPTSGDELSRKGAERTLRKRKMPTDDDHYGADASNGNPDFSASENGDRRQREKHVDSEQPADGGERPDADRATGQKLVGIPTGMVKEFIDEELEERRIDEESDPLRKLALELERERNTVRFLRAQLSLGEEEMGKMTDRLRELEDHVNAIIERNSTETGAEPSPDGCAELRALYEDSRSRERQLSDELKEARERITELEGIRRDELIMKRFGRGGIGGTDYYENRPPGRADKEPIHSKFTLEEDEEYDDDSGSEGSSSGEDESLRKLYRKRRTSERKIQDKSAALDLGEAAQRLQDYMPVQEQLEIRCYKYGMLFGHRGKVTKALVKTIAQLDIPQANTFAPSSEFFDDLRTIKRVLDAGSRSKANRRVAAELERCLALNKQDRPTEPSGTFSAVGQETKLRPSNTQGGQAQPQIPKEFRLGSSQADDSQSQIGGATAVPVYFLDRGSSQRSAPVGPLTPIGLPFGPGVGPRAAVHRQQRWPSSTVVAGNNYASASSFARAGRTGASASAQAMAHGITDEEHAEMMRRFGNIPTF